GVRTVLGQPLIRDGKAIGVIQIRRADVRPFTDRQIELLKTFADQAVIAIENTRLFEEVQARTKELQESLDRQTATSEVLGVISRSPNEVQPVLDTIVATAGRLCQAERAIVWRLEGETFRVVAHHGLPEERVESLYSARMPLSRESMSGRAALARRAVQVEDEATDPELSAAAHAFARTANVHTVLAVPLLLKGHPIGVIGLARTRVARFDDKQIALVEAFADQAVIAIENSRLFEAEQASKRELTESLEQQTATADVLKVISRSALDVQKVLDALVESAARLCDAYDAAIFQVFGDGLRLMAHHGQIPTSRPVGQVTVPLGREFRFNITGRAVIDRRTIHVADALAEADEYPESRKRALQQGYRTSLAVPLVHAGEAIGVILIRRAEVRPFTERQIELVNTFADQAVIAIENTRLFDEVQQKNAALNAANSRLTDTLEQQTATSEILKVIASSPSDVQPVFDAIVAAAPPLVVGGISSSVRLLKGDTLNVVAWTGLSKTEVASRGLSVHIGSDPQWARLVHDRQAIAIADLETDISLNAEHRDEMRKFGVRSALVVPLLQDGLVIGAIGVGRAMIGPFAEHETRILQTFADQAVIAIENTRLFEAEQARTREVEVKSTELARSLEYQTAISEVLGVISRSPKELQPVFNTIVASSKRLLRAHSAGVTRVIGNELRLAAFTAINPETDRVLQNVYPMRLDGSGSIVAAIHKRTHFMIEDMEADDGYPRAAVEVARLRGYRSILFVPMLSKGEAI